MYYHRKRQTSVTKTVEISSVFPLKSIEERITVLSLIGFDIEPELRAYRWRLNLHKDYYLKTGQMQDYQKCMQKISILENGKGESNLIFSFHYQPMTESLSLSVSESVFESVFESVSESISESVSESFSESVSESVSGSEVITPAQQVPSQTLSESVHQALTSTGQESQNSLSLLGGMLLFGLLKKKKQKEEQE